MHVVGYHLDGSATKRIPVLLAPEELARLIKAKIRQVLQQIPNTGEIKFVDGQRSYRINDSGSMATSFDSSADAELDLILIMNEVDSNSPITVILGAFYNCTVSVVSQV